MTEKVKDINDSIAYELDKSSSDPHLPKIIVEKTMRHSHTIHNITSSSLASSLPNNLKSTKSTKYISDDEMSDHIQENRPVVSPGLFPKNQSDLILNILKQENQDITNKVNLIFSAINISYEKQNEILVETLTQIITNDKRNMKKNLFVIIGGALFNIILFLINIFIKIYVK